MAHGYTRAPTASLNASHLHCVFLFLFWVNIHEYIMEFIYLRRYVYMEEPLDRMLVGKATLLLQLTMAPLFATCWLVAGKPLDKIDWRERHGNICDLILELTPDIAALQEFCFATPGTLRMLFFASNTVHVCALMIFLRGVPPHLFFYTSEVMMRLSAKCPVCYCFVSCCHTVQALKSCTLQG